MKLVKRYDYLPNSSTVETTPEGFLRVQARAARVGVLKYRQLDGTILRELVPPEELFKPESMSTLSMKPITNNHPEVLLDSENATLYQVGFTGETVRKDEEKFLSVSTVITDKKTISEAESGKVEVSPGYVCELDFTPGVFDGEEYDAVQRNRRYNHLAVVRKGRSGPEVRLRLDAEDAVQVELNQSKESKKVKIKLDGKEFEVADEVGAAMEAEMKKCKSCGTELVEGKCPKCGEKMDSLTKSLEAATKEKDQLQAKCDGYQAEIEKLKKERTDSADAGKVDVQKLVRERIALEKVASAAGVEKFDSLSDQELKKAVILSGAPETKLDGKSEEYINARFDVAAEAISASDVKAKKIGEEINKGEREKSEKMDADSARAKMIERQQNAWKKGKEE